MWGLRQYRQKENSPPDTPIKELDDVTDCARYLEIVRPFAPTYEDRAEIEERKQLDPISRKATDEFDELAEKAMKPKQDRGEIW